MHQFMKHVNEKSKIQYSFWNFFRLVVERVLGGAEKKKQHSTWTLSSSSSSIFLVCFKTSRFFYSVTAQGLVASTNLLGAI